MKISRIISDFILQRTSQEAESVNSQGFLESILSSPSKHSDEAYVFDTVTRVLNKSVVKFFMSQEQQANEFLCDGNPFKKKQKIFKAKK